MNDKIRAFCQDRMRVGSMAPFEATMDRFGMTPEQVKEALGDMICSRCSILIRQEGGHLCGDCGRDI